MLNVIAPEQHTRYLLPVTSDSKTFELITITLLYLTGTLLFVNEIESKMGRTRYIRNGVSMATGLTSFLREYRGTTEPAAIASL